MSSPTPGSDPNYPQGGAPQGQPGWGAPQQPAPGYTPAPSYSAAPAGYGAAGQRPGMVTAAGDHRHRLGRPRRSCSGCSALGRRLRLRRAARACSCWSSVAAVGRAALGRHPGDPGQVAAAAAADQLRRDRRQLLTLIIGARAGRGSIFSGLLGFVLPGVIVFLLLQPAVQAVLRLAGHQLLS